LVPPDDGFHFCIENGVYTKVTTVSLADFAEKLQKIEINSVLFHFPRGDFQSWIKSTLGDEELAHRISKIKSNIVAENLSKQLEKLVNRRIIELSRISRHSLAGLYVEE
jgi:tyrosine-protein phosphatase YwqE